MNQRQFLRTYLWPQRPLLLWLTLLLLSNIGLKLLNPQLLRRFIDEALAAGDQTTLGQTAVFFILIALLTQAATVATTYISQQIAWRSTNALRYDLVSHSLQRSLTFHNQHTPGELIERIDGDVSSLANFFSQFLVQILGNGLLFGGILLLLFREGWQVGTALTAFALLSLAIVYRMRNLATPYWEAERQANADLAGFLEERLAALEELRANGAVPYMLYRLHQLLRQLYLASRKAYTMLLVVYSSSLGLFAVGNVIALAVSSYLLQQNQLTVGAIYLIFHYTQMLRQPLEEMMFELGDWQQATASMRRIRQLLQPMTQTAVFPPAVSPPAHSPAIRFDNVSFAYDATVPVLRQLSFALPAGAVLGIVGQTGSGKSTLGRLLGRLYEPTDGTIWIDGQDLRQLDRAAWRQQVGVVTQTVQLFQASVRDNLTLFTEGVDNGRLINLLNSVGLGNWLAALPNGLETMIGSGGEGMSAGEAQLLAFARVLLKEPQLVVLDEASSRLDLATEQQLERAIDMLLEQRTAVVIAHRLHTIQRADYILLLENGRLREFAPREQLATDPSSRFYQLLQAAALPEKP